VISNQDDPLADSSQLPPVPAGPFLFVSYASIDRPQVLSIVGALREAGLDLWVDQAGIAGGAAYGTEIASAIQGSAAVALMCSTASLESRNVRQEIMLAWRYDRPILPLLLEMTTFPDEVAYWLEGAQWIEVLSRPAQAWLPEVGRALARHGLSLTASVVPSVPVPGPPADFEIVEEGNLPVPHGPLIGRERELRELPTLVGQARWVTLTGPGGTGKTRLALDVARRADFADGAWFVDLANVTDPEAVLPAIAAALEVSEEAGRSALDVLAEYLAGKRLLLVLDNLEQVVAGAGHAAQLLEGCADLVVLATSRVPLKVSGEWVYAVGQLGVPDLVNLPPLPTLAQNPAVRLFVERAQEARRDFVLTEGMARPVAEICQRLDGLPLAIELAAARVRLLSPPVILTRLGSRLTLLSRGGAISARQQTLRNTITWSHELLSDVEKAAFRRLAVFAGGSSVEAAEEVIAAVESGESPSLDDIAALVDNSLLQTESGGADDTPRVRMLETIREYATEQLAECGEERETRKAHAAFFAEYAMSREADLLNPQPGPALANLRAEEDNLRGALDWLAAADGAADLVDAELRMVAALARFWRRLGRYHEAASRFEDVLQRGRDGDPEARAKVLHGAGFVAGQRGDTAYAVACHEEALQLSRSLGDLAGEATALMALAEVSEYAGDYARALDLREQVLKHRLEIGDDVEIAVAAHDLGVSAIYVGDYATAFARIDEAMPIFRRQADARNLAMALFYKAFAETFSGEGDAIRHFEESLALWQSLDDRYAVAYATINKGRALQIAGRNDEAAPVLDEALAEFSELGDTGGISLALYGLALIALARDDTEQAFTQLTESLRLAHAANQQWHIAERIEAMAEVWVRRSEPVRAARLLGGAARMREWGGFPIPPAMRLDYERTVAAIGTALGPDEISAAMSAGRALTVDELVAEALG
jgi:predicted ATPase